MFGFGGFIERTVISDPLVILAVDGGLFPQPDDSALVVVVVPKVGDVPSAVGVPLCVLTTRIDVQVKNGVDTVFGAKVDHPIKVFEPLFLENPRVHIVCKTG